MASRIVETAYVANIDDLRVKLAQAAALNEKAGASIGTTFEKGTTKAGGAVTKLSKELGNLGLPLTSPLAKLGAGLDQMTAKSGKFLSVLSEIGKVGSAAGLAAFAAAAFEGVKGASALQEQMEQLHTQAGASQAQVKTLTNAILNMAGSVGTSPQTLAEGMYHVVSSLNATLPAAKRVSTELAVLKLAAEGAKVGNANLVDVTNALDDAVLSGIPGVQNFQQAMGALNATVGAGDMTMQQLADALSTGLLAPMKTYGLSITDVGGASALMGDHLIRGEEAATKLTSAVRIMAAPSGAAQKALGSIGLGALQLANDIRSGGLVAALSDLKTHLKDSGDTAAQQGLVIARAFGGRQSTGVQVLLQYLDALKLKTAAVASGANNFGAAWYATTHTISFEWSQVTAGAQAFADKLGLYLIPKLQSLGTFVANNKTAFEDLAKVFTGALAVAVGAFVGSEVAGFVAGIGKMIAATEAFILKYQTMRNAEIASNSMMAASAEATAGTVDAALIGTGIGAAVVALGVAAAELQSHWSTVINALVNAAIVAENGINHALNGISKTISDLTGGLVKLGTQQIYAGTGGGPGQAGVKGQRTIYTNSTNGQPYALPTSTTKAQYDEIVKLTGGANGSTTYAAIAKAIKEVEGKQKTNSSGLTAAEEAIKQASFNASPAGKTAQAQIQADEILLKSATGMQKVVDQAQVALDKLNANPNATPNQIAAAQAALTVAQAKATASTNNSVPSGLAGAASTALTPAQLQLETFANQFLGMVKTASAGGTSFSQQGRTVASLTSATSARNAGTEANLVNSLNASNNPNLTALASRIESTWQSATSKLITVIDSDTTKGQSEIQKLQTAANASNFSSLKGAVTGEAQTTFTQLVTELKSVHSSKLTSLITNLQNNWAAAKAAYKSLGSDLKTIASADAQQMAAAVTSGQTTAAGNASTAAVGISALQSTQTADQLNAAAAAIADAAKIQTDQVTQQTQAITDAAKLMSDAAQAQVQAIQAQTTAMQDATSAQVAAINDQTQTQVDTLAERGLYGLALQAQMAKVALDEQKAIDDQQIAAAQAHLDQVTAQTTAAVQTAQYQEDLVTQQTNASVASAQMAVDIQQQASDAAEAAAQANADQVAINGAIAEAAIQASVDSQAIVDAINVQTAQAHADAVQYNGAQATTQAQAQLTQQQAIANNAEAQLASQQQAITDNTNALNQNAANAYQQAQASASQQMAGVNATLTAAQSAASLQQAQAAAALSAANNNASVQQALAQQGLVAVQSTATLTEAKLTQIYNVDQELANTQFAGSGLNIYVTSQAASDEAAVTAAGSYLYRYKAS